MKRFGMVIGIQPDKIEEYKKLHAAVWPDVLKMINMFETTKNNIIGIVENMKYITCPDSDERIELFPVSEDNKDFSGFKYETIAAFPFIPGIGNKDKDGTPFYLRNRDHDTSKEYDKLADRIIK